MAKKICINILKAATSEFMNSADADAFLKDLEERTQKKIRAGLEDKAAALNQSVDDMVAAEDFNVKLKQRHTYLTIAAEQKWATFKEAFKDVGEVEANQGYLTGTLRYKVAGRRSMDASMKNHREELCGDFYRAMNQTNDWQNFQKNKELSPLIAEEFFKPNSTGNDAAFRIANHMRDVYEKGRRLLNRWGADIQDLDTFVANQIHDTQTMRRPLKGRLASNNMKIRLIKELGKRAGEKEYQNRGYKRWRNFIVPLLNRELLFRNITTEEETFFRQVYDALISGVHNTPTGSKEDINNYTSLKPASRAARLSAHRILPFKGGQEWETYNREYGTGSLPTSVYETLEKMGKNIGIMKFYGPNSTATFNKIQAEIRSGPERTDPKIDAKLGRAKNFFDLASGLTNTPENEVLAQWGGNFRSFNTLVRLPLVMITSWNDTAIRASEMRDRGIGFFDRWSQIATGSMQGVAKEDRKDLAAGFRIFGVAQVGGFSSRMAAFDSPAGMMAKSMQMFWKYNGMNWWDRVTRQSHAISMGAQLGRMKDTTFDNIDPLLKRVMQDYGIGDKEWDFYRKHAVTTLGEDKTTFVSPDLVRQAGRDGIQEYINSLGAAGKNLTVQDAEDELSDTLGSYFIDRTDHAILRPDLADSSFIVRGARRGTVWGELTRSIAHFKTFSVSYARKVLGRKLYGGNINGNPDILGIAEIMTTSMIIGGVVIAAKNIIAGKIPRPFNWRLVSAAMLQGGGMGIYGDFLFGDYNRYGQSFTGTLIGPELGTLNQAVTFLDKLAKMDHPAQAAFQFFGNNIPFINMAFVKTGLDYLFLYGLAEHLSPGYLDRMQRNLQKNQDTQFIMPPSQFALRPFG